MAYPVPTPLAREPVPLLDVGLVVLLVAAASGQAHAALAASAVRAPLVSECSKAIDISLNKL